MWKLTKQYLKDVWAHLLGKTEIDEKIIATARDVKKRYKLTMQELQDVAKAINNVGDQLEDVGDALKGKSRRGRKPKK